MGGCDVCEARAARLCENCYVGDPVFAFQVSLAVPARFA